MKESVRGKGEIATRIIERVKDGTYSLMINKLARGNDSPGGGTDTIDFITSTLRQHSRLIFQVEGLWVSQYDAS